MRKRLFGTLILLSICLVVVAQAQKDATEKNLVGSWSGAWSGGSNGVFELTITKGADGKMGGSITPKPEGGESYTATFSSVVQAGNKVTLKLTDPGGEVEITI